MPAIKLYNNLTTGRFSAGPSNTNPFKSPIEMVQKSTVQVDVYFLEETGNPQSPWTVIDPSIYTDVYLWVGNVLTNTTYADVSGTLGSDSFGSKMSFYLPLTSSLIKTDMGIASALAALLEVGFTSGYISPKTQIGLKISRASTSAGPVPPVPNPYALGKYSATIGNGIDDVLTITHNLDTTAVSLTLIEVSSGTAVAVDWAPINANAVQLTFGSVPTANQYQVTIIG